MPVAIGRFLVLHRDASAPVTRVGRRGASVAHPAD